MKYTKPFLSLQQQVDQLVRRGMTVNDRQRAEYYLQHISYYRLRAYWLPCEVPAAQGDHAFRSGTDFDDILDLYVFDRKLRLLVMDVMERVEVSLRTRWAYVLGMHYGAHAFEDNTLFRDNTKHRKCLNSLDEELQRSHETFIKHYRSTYSQPEMPPLWMVSEILTFGQLSQWFGNLRHGKDRIEIARPYKLDEQVLASLGHHLAYVRNVCAHHSRLWNRELTISMKLPNHPRPLRASFNDQSPKRIYNTLVILMYLLDQISPGSTWRTNVCDLIAAHPKVDLAAMGFPADWQRRAIWQGAIP